MDSTKVGPQSMNLLTKLRTWPDHQGIGGLNRARIAIYAKLSEFRHHRDGHANLA